MLDAATLIARDAELFAPTYARLDLVFERGEGPWLITADGRRYLDCVGGLAVNSLGYAHPSLIQAIDEQIRRYTHLSNMFVQQPQVELAARLTALTGQERVFFCNSGAEAAEAAFKLVRKWARSRARSEMIAFDGGFHGRTMAPLSLMSQEKYRDGFGPFLGPVRMLPFNDVDALTAAVHSGTAAVFIECIQGEGGIRVATREFIDAIEVLRREHGFLVVADEVQSGTGRTGRFLACEHWNLTPDLVLLAKAIGGGLPLGALLTSSALAQIFGIGGHGTTFGGNPVACAAGVACIDELLRHGWMNNAAAIGGTVLQAFEEHARHLPGMIADVRGMGCMLGIELRIPAAPVARYCRERGVLVNVTQDHVIRLLPPLILDPEHVQLLVSTLSAAIQAEADDSSSKTDATIPGTSPPTDHPPSTSPV